MKNYARLCVLAISVAVIAAGCAIHPQSEREYIPESASRAEQSIASVSDIHFLGQGTPLGDGNADGYYYLKQREDGSFNIKYIDYESRTELYLCNRPECTHDNEGCPSWRPYGGSMGSAIPLGNNLYTIFYGSSIEQTYVKFGELAKMRIERSALDGSNNSTLVTFSANESLNGGIAADNMHLYMIVEIVSEEEDKTETYWQVYSINLSDGTITKSKKMQKTDIHIVGAAGRELILLSYNVKDILSESLVEYSLYNVDTGELTQLDVPFSLSANAQCCGEFLCWLDIEQNTLCKINVLNKEMISLPIQENFSQFNEIQLSYDLPNYVQILLYKQDQPVKHGLLNLNDGSFYYLTLEVDSSADIQDRTIPIFAEADDETFLVAQEVEYYPVNFSSGEQKVALMVSEYKFALLPIHSCLSNQKEFEEILDLGA